MPRPSARFSASPFGIKPANLQPHWVEISRGGVVTPSVAQPKGEFNEKNSSVFFNPSYHFDW